MTIDIIKSKDDLKLTAEQGFQVVKATSSFKLVFSDDLNNTKFESLLKVLKTSVTTHFFSSPSEKQEIATFVEAPAFLELHFGSVVLSERIPVAPPVGV